MSRWQRARSATTTPPDQSGGLQQATEWGMGATRGDEAGRAKAAEEPDKV